MSESKCEYANDGERITAPGKFEGGPVFAPHYWGLALEGLSDDDNGSVFTFRFTKSELERTSTAFGAEIQKWLGNRRTLRMSEDSQGFVHCF